ncbi:hypothetical protein ILYODFUR_008109 [Ilyodon furcidens]|uniref:Uncharacterized protein n=1 Tax=Ilyodon furcidens TaxID=33524 RepID=A0ABV0UFR2_9TELE
MSRKYEDAAGIVEVSEKIKELLLASKSLPDVTAATRRLTNLAATQRVILTPSQQQTIKQWFCCVVCMMRIPAVGCKGLLLQLNEASAPVGCLWDSHSQPSHLVYLHL